jgi:hypothetical protein
MASRGEVVLAETEEAFATRLDQVVLDPQAFRVTPREPGGPATARRIGDLVAALIDGRVRSGADV